MLSSSDTKTLPHDTAPPEAASLNDASKNETSGNLEVKHPGIGERTSSDDPWGWNTVVKRDRKKNPGQDITPKSNRGEKGRNWKRSILHGTASNNQPGGNALSADVDLVAYGFAKHVTSIQLSKYLEEMGLMVVDCTLLTKYEGARTLSFKITIKPQCFERAKDPSILPYRVGLRLYKYFNQNNKKNASTDRRITFANETRGILRN